MLDALLRTAGVDPQQWRTLVWVYARVDFRAGGGAARRGEAASRRGKGIIGLTVVSVMWSLGMAAMVWRIPDTLLSAACLTTYGAFNTGLILLLDFTSMVLSPDDYLILAARPVSSRTYFAARLTSVLMYVGGMAAVFALLPALVYVFWWQLGWVAGAATIVALVLSDSVLAILVITVYTALLSVISPAKVRRATSYLQLVLMMSFYGMIWVLVDAQQSWVTTLSFDRLPLLWLNPASWFAAIVPLAAHERSAALFAAAGGATALTIASVPLAAGRLSLDYARRIGELMASGEPARHTRTRLLPGFTSGEARAMTLLVLGHFRNEQRFRLAVLGLLPLSFFYILMGLRDGVLADPFVTASKSAFGPYMALMFMPMTLHAALRTSDHWRAGWVFFTTPASHARLLLAAKNVVTVCFIGGYALLLALFWSFFYDRVWHAVVHAAIVGILAHLLLQCTVFAQPTIPFSAEPRRAERSSAVLVVMFVGGTAAVLLGVLLPFVYARPAWTLGFIAMLMGLTAAMEWLLRRRVDEEIAGLEFRG
jgi:ABC-2 type transport system permease protein